MWVDHQVGGEDEGDVGVDPDLVVDPVRVRRVRLETRRLGLDAKGAGDRPGRQREEDGDDADCRGRKPAGHEHE
jgi:hypothetical protein